MAIDNTARALGSQGCNTIHVNGDNFISVGGEITLPNYPNDGGGAFYTAGDNIIIDENNIISGNYQLADTLNDGIMSSEDKIKVDALVLVVGDVDATPDTYVIRDSDADIQTNGIDFDLTPTSATIPVGHMQWNPTFKTLSFGTSTDSSVEIGQEVGFPIRNGINGIMANGTVVYWTESIGASGRVKVSPFIADGSIVAERCLGINTQELAKNEDGRSTWLGSIYGIDTTGTPYGEVWVSGDIIYASATIAGGMTKVRPECPNIALRLGIVILAHATQGQIATKTQIYPTSDQICNPDIGNYYISDTIDGVFQEMGDKLTNLFNDLPPVPFLTTKVGATAPTLTTFVGNIQLYTFGVNDESYGDTEVTHLYKEGTNLMPHIHWITNGTNVDNRYVKWEMEYTWSNDTNAFPTSTVISIEKEIPANTPTRKHFITDFPVISGANMEIGAYLCWRVRRIASTGTAPTNNPFGLAVGVHAYEDILQ